MNQRASRFTLQHIMIGNSEVLRALVILLFTKGVISKPEAMLMHSEAKRQIMRNAPDAEFGETSCAYVDELLGWIDREIPPDAPPPPVQ